MNLSYKFNIKSSHITSDFVVTNDPAKSDLYINKDYGWFDLDVVINSSRYSFEPILYDTKSYSTKTVFKTNTANVKLTDVYIEKPYFYVLQIEGLIDVYENLLVSLLNTKDIINYNGKFYTNTKSYYSDSNGIVIYTRPVIDIDTCVINYKSKYIEITCPPNSYIDFYDYIISPFIINQYSFYIPSFYLLTNQNKLNRCIESNVQYFDLISDVSENSYLKYKLYEAKESFSLIKEFNISSYSLDTIKATYKKSTHCFNIFDNYNYFSIQEDGSIIKSNAKDYDFIIRRKINLDKIDLIPNTYKLIEKEPNFIGGVVNQVKELNKTVNDFGVHYNKIDTYEIYDHYISTPVLNYFQSHSNYEIPDFINYKSLHEDAVILRIMDIKENEEVVSTFDNVSYRTIIKRGNIPMVYALVSYPYPIETVPDSTITSINKFIVNVIETKREVYETDTHSGLGASLLDLNLKKVITYNTYNSDMDSYSGLGANLVSLNLNDTIRYSSHDTTLESHSGTGAQLMNLTLKAYPIVPYDLVEQTTTNIGNIIISIS